MSDIHWTRAAVLRLAIASLVLIGALFLFVFPTSSLLHQRSQLNDAQNRLTVLTEQTKRLSEQSKRVLSDEEIERIARGQFNMVKPGEQAWAIVPGPTTTTVPPVLPAVP
jgi:cell division protein FtsB